jgi:NADH:ubiquinone oxidoreductase subunit 6 (subunit J)
MTAIVVVAASDTTQYGVPGAVVDILLLAALVVVIALACRR